MSTRNERNPRSTQLLGAIGLAVIATVVALLIATYFKVFADVVPVTVEADRAGLLLDRGSRVRLSGVAVGEVRETKLRPDGRVEIELAIDEDKADLIPSNVTASIKATTVFGSKFVDLQSPADSSNARSLRAGDVINADAVTIEVNDVFRHGIGLLKSVRPSELNTSLTTASRALNGRGERFGEFFADWNKYLESLEPHLDEVESIFGAAPGVLETYATAAPGLIDTADNLASTSDTLVAKADQFELLLRDAIDGVDSAQSFLRVLEAPLRAFNDQMLPVTALAARYAPEYECVIHGVREQIKIYKTFFGNREQGEHYFYASVGFLPGQDAYTLAENRPRIVTGVGPVCYPVATKKHPWLPHIRFQDGLEDVYSSSATGGLALPSTDPVKLYSGLVGDWFGDAGAAELLKGRER